jgi:hypothetical protein
MESLIPQCACPIGSSQLCKKPVTNASDIERLNILDGSRHLRAIAEPIPAFAVYRY